MKKVNLIEYFDLAQALHQARQTTGADKIEGGELFFSTWRLPNILREFANQENGFSACRHPAVELADKIDAWISDNILDANSRKPDIEKFGTIHERWSYSQIGTKIDEFISVFKAECRDLDIYSVEQMSIYKTMDLVSRARNVIPYNIQAQMPETALAEFDEAGRCLAFDLSTACGFHALRGLELVMSAYLSSYGVQRKPPNWGQYIKEIEKLENESSASHKPSAKVKAMLDRMRDLDRNPLMHPEDTLDRVGADLLFRLATITATELVRDMKPKGPSKAGRSLVSLALDAGE